jgi:hypothetical protein
MTLVRRALLGLLWLTLGSALFATPIVKHDPDPAQADQIASANLAKFNNPAQALDELCFNPPYFMVVAGPDDSIGERPNYSDVLPTQLNIQVGDLNPPPTSMAISGVSLIMAGLVRRRTRV